MKFFHILKKDEAGATAIEYGLIAALIAVAAITALTSLGDNLSGTFTTVAGKMESTGGADAPADAPPADAPPADAPPTT